MNDVQKLKRYKIISCILSLIMLFQAVGCKNYFLVEKLPNNISNIESSTYKSVIVHWHNSSYDLNDITVDSTSISGLLDLLTNEFDYKLHSWDQEYKAKDKNYINALHIYLTYTYPKLNSGTIKIYPKDITKIEFVKKNARKTTISHILGWTCISVFVAIIVGTAIDPPANISFSGPSF